ncbi:hypothetical protein CTI12_AA250310 [Artemisia annua]|uniref:Uncharacterized protein n=1 Tax=Artemisia annua TaxID=35608 RepID=A0A2U1NM10_ARTAN|nr:hypothetical protein CTI12_AA250310 [Artemisia annua]
MKIPILIILTLATTSYSSTDNNHVFSPCTDTTVQKSDGFTFGIAFSSRNASFLNSNNSTVQLSPCDKRLSLSSLGAQLAVFRPKVDEISLLTINNTNFQPGTPNIWRWAVRFDGVLNSRVGVLEMKCNDLGVFGIRL